MKSAHQRISGSVQRQIHQPVYLLAYLLLVLPACAQTPTLTVETVNFSLVADTSTAPLIDELVAAYLASRPHVTIQVEHAPNAERTLEALQAKWFDLASVSWLPEKEKVEGTLWHRPIARDAIVMITHPTNPVGGVAVLELRRIFRGQTLAWEDLGGLALDVIPVAREEGAGTRLSFESLVMGGHDVTPTAVVMPSNEAVAAYVSATPGAIGYISADWLVPAVNLLAVEGTTPAPTSVADGHYLLARPFSLVAHTEPDGGLAEFVEWIRVGDGLKIVKRQHAPAP